MKAIIVLTILLISSILFIYIYFTGFFYYTKITPCSPPPNIQPDGRVSALVFTWEDLNKNGYYEEGEPALPNVPVTHPLTLDVNSATNNEGLARTVEFIAHCPCKCWQNTFVEVGIPNGFSPSTVTRQVLTGENPTLFFGFSRVN